MGEGGAYQLNGPTLSGPSHPVPLFVRRYGPTWRTPVQQKSHTFSCHRESPWFGRLCFLVPTVLVLGGLCGGAALLVVTHRRRKYPRRPPTA